MPTCVTVILKGFFPVNRIASILFTSSTKQDQKPLLGQDCCLTGARSPEAPDLQVRATKILFKEPTWNLHSHLICPMTVALISLWNQSKNHSQNKLNQKQQPPIWSCFAFITKNMGQKTARESLCCKTQETKAGIEIFVKKLQYLHGCTNYWIFVTKRQLVFFLSHDVITLLYALFQKLIDVTP